MSKHSSSYLKYWNTARCKYNTVVHVWWPLYTVCKSNNDINVPTVTAVLWLLTNTRCVVRVRETKWCLLFKHHHALTSPNPKPVPGSLESLPVEQAGKPGRVGVLKHRQTSRAELSPAGDVEDPITDTSLCVISVCFLPQSKHWTVIQIKPEIKRFGCNYWDSAPIIVVFLTTSTFLSLCFVLFRCFM